MLDRLAVWAWNAVVNLAWAALKRLGCVRLEVTPGAPQEPLTWEVYQTPWGDWAARAGCFIADGFSTEKSARLWATWQAAVEQWNREWEDTDA